MDLPSSHVPYLGRVRFRHWRTAFGIRPSDRVSHIYLIGRTGSGKTTALECLARQDMTAGHGFALLDPHGDLARRVAASVPRDRESQITFFDGSQSASAFAYNPLADVPPVRRPLAAAGFLEVLEKLWDRRSWGPRMEHVLRNALLALLDQEDATLPDVLRLFRDRSFRRSVTRRIQDPHVRAFWQHEYENYSYRYRAEAVAPIQSKLGAFIADPRVRRVLSGEGRTVSFRRLMDEGGIFIANLARGELGEGPSSLLGGLFATSIGLAAFSREDTPERERRPFFFYLDEFHSFTTRSLATMTSELRKYGVGLVLAHQYLDQLSPEVKHAVLGNAGTIVAFRVGAEDAPVLSREFAGVFAPEDLVTLPNYHIYLKLMIDGAPSRAFSATTLTPEEALAVSRPVESARSMQSGGRCDVRDARA